MKRLFCIAALFFVCFGTGITAANRLNASPAIFQIDKSYYDATRDFSTATNPNGVWKYGWSEGIAGRLVLYSRSSTPDINNDLEEGWDDPNNSSGFTPSVAINSGDDFDDGNVTFSAGALILHPCGVDGQAYCHVIWKAPRGGAYFLTSSFFAQQNGINVDVHILVNGESVFDSTITQNSVVRSFSKKLMLHAGSTIDFTVGPNDNFIQHAGNTGLQAVILPE
jgi:hypothetical protein